MYNPFFPVSTPSMFRLMDYERFARERTLRIFETPKIPDVPYVALSFLQTETICRLHRRQGCPLSIEKLHQLCSDLSLLNAVLDSTRFVWIDMLCMYRRDFKGSNELVQHIAEVFRSCERCMVCPRGLQYCPLLPYQASQLGVRALLGVLAAPRVDVVGWEDFQKWLSYSGNLTECHYQLLMGIFSYRYPTFFDIYCRDLALWKYVLQIEDPDDENLLLIMILLVRRLKLDLPSLESSVAYFEQEASDPCSQNPTVIALRDALSLVNSDISFTWERIMLSLKIPTVFGPIRGTMGVSYPCSLSRFAYRDDLRTYEIVLTNLTNTSLDTSHVSTPRRFRLLDCERYMIANVLTIRETDSIPKHPYVTLSYPWVGVPLLEEKEETFRVRRGEGGEGDPISIQLLKLVCRLAIMHNAPFLWVDRLCISQLDANDKPWQIHRMCEVYKRCRMCIVLPGGLQRLTDLGEEAPWITRMWTLQEAIVPPSTIVLYSVQPFSHWDPTLWGHQKLNEDSLTAAAYYGPLQDLTSNYMHEDSDTKIRLLGNPSNGYGRLLHEALSSRDHSYKNNNSNYKRYLAIWQSAITRSSDRPQDLLLSTMGIFNIELEEGAQRSQDSVFAAFVKELRKEGFRGVRITAFRDAISHADTSMSTQWRHLIDDIHRSFPLLDGGISPSLDGFPPDRAGLSIFDDDARNQIFLGSALLIEQGKNSESLQPCPVAVATSTSFSCRVMVNGQEKEHDGHWELLPFDPERMEWVSTWKGSLSSNRTPVEGGYETIDPDSAQASLYHALVTLTGPWGKKERFIGKGRKALHLQKGCIYNNDGKKHLVHEDYQILCWKDGECDDDDELRLEEWEEWKSSVSDLESGSGDES
ncbi:hypothetical protein QCA50_011114 [Cerrena zonata]|uniref:Heterokaryon incompatibility domain-containing protein n=1 Tax=Cerrena zonata TaxID=2478898 RepID=A0AAW0FXI8_9APHY